MFLIKESNYARNVIIKDLLSNTEVKRLKILPCFHKKQFIQNFFKRSIIINDFFISDYDNNVCDRKNVSKFSLQAIKYYFLDFISFKFSKYLLADTEEHLKYWCDLFGKPNAKTYVLPILADNKIFKPESTPVVQNESAPLEVFFYGSFIPLHGLDLILKTIKNVENENIHFTIVGQGQETEKFKKLLNELNIQKNKLNYIDERIDQDEIVKLMYSSDIVLGIFGTSRKARSVVPNKVYEALACKKCVLTMDSLAIREFFNDDHLALVDNNVDSFSKKLIELNNSRESIQLIADKGYEKYIEMFSTYQKDFANFINQIDKEI